MVAYGTQAETRCISVNVCHSRWVNAVRNNKVISQYTTLYCSYLSGIKINNSSYERVEEFKYLGTTLTDQNSILEEIKSRLKSRNACCHSVQNISSFSLLSKNFNIKIYVQKYNFACCFVWVWNLVTHTEEGT